MYLPNIYSTSSNWRMFKFKLVGSTRLLVHIQEVTVSVNSILSYYRVLPCPGGLCV